MASKVEICNLALARLGAALISSLTEDTKGARLCNALFDMARDRVLQTAPWNFAAARATLARLTETPDFEYDYAYQLPADCIQVRSLQGTTSDWVVEQGRLLINDDEVNCRYTARVEDPAGYPPHFVECLALMLAVQLARPLAGSTTLEQELKKELRAALNRARAEGAVEDDPPEETEETTWQSAGR